MILELLLGYWAFKPFVEEVDKFSYEYERMYNDIEDLKVEIQSLKINNY